MFSKFISIGDKIELQAVSHEFDEKPGAPVKVYHSEVNEIQSEDTIEIKMPMEKTKLILLPIDSEYDMIFYGSSGLFQCLGRVIDRYKSNNAYLLLVEMTSNLRKYQRREYYRLSCALEMDSRPLQADEVRLAEAGRRDKRMPELPLKNSIIADISGGGLRFVADYAYDKESLIMCRYRLQVDKEEKEYNLVGKVLDVKEVENRPGTFEHRVQYINMDTEEREEIIKYIFDEERRTLRNQKRYQ